MSNNNKIGFGTLKIPDSLKSRQIRRIILSSLLLFLVCFNYSMLRCLKDTVVLTASSATVIPFIKVWTLLPMAILFTFGYTWLTSRLKRQLVFYLIVCGFLSFFLLFAFVIYPISEHLRLEELATLMRGFLPKGLHGFISMIEYWSLTLFYIVAELWSNLVLSVLTWGFINQITSLKEASRFYSWLGAASNIAAIGAGVVSNIILSMSTNMPWEETLQINVVVLVSFGVIAMVIYRQMNKDLLKEENNVFQKTKKKKIKFSLSESFQEISKSKHLLSLATIVVAYFFVINTVEIVWKEQLRNAYTSPEDLNHYMNTLTILIGVISTILAFCMGKFIRRWGWSKTAMITPAVMFVTSILFFSFLIFRDALAPVVAVFGLTPVMVAVFLGGLQNCLSKSAKYSIFDATKEMAFIPLSREQQLKGKAAIDGVGSRLGKSGSSLANQFFMLACGGLVACTPLIGTLMISVIIGWVFATKSLGRRLDAHLAAQRVRSIDEYADEGSEQPESSVASDDSALVSSRS